MTSISDIEDVPPGAFVAFAPTRFDEKWIKKAFDVIPSKIWGKVLNHTKKPRPLEVFFFPEDQVDDFALDEIVDMEISSAEPLEYQRPPYRASYWNQLEKHKAKVPAAQEVVVGKRKVTKSRKAAATEDEDDDPQPSAKPGISLDRLFAFNLLIVFCKGIKSTQAKAPAQISSLQPLKKPKRAMIINDSDSEEGD